MIEETKPSPASVITSISDLARSSHLTASLDYLLQGQQPEKIGNFPTDSLTDQEIVRGNSKKKDNP